MKIGIITQARTGSKRLPKKVLKKINDLTFLQIHLRRVIKSKLANIYIVATTDSKKDDIICNLSIDEGFKVYRGSEDDVLDRYYKAAKENKIDVIVRLTSDCPLIDPELIDIIIQKHFSYKKDFTSNVTERTFPDGLDVEVFNFKILEKAWVNSKNKSDREHVTHYIWKNEKIFTNYCFKNKVDYSKYRLTLDYPEDLKLFKSLIKKIGYKNHWTDYVELIKNNKSLYQINKSRIIN